MTWLAAAVCAAGFIAGSIDERPAPCAACGVAAIYFTLKSIGAVHYAVDLMSGPTIPPPPADQAETLAEIPGEKSGKRTSDRKLSSKQRERGAA